MLGIKTSIKRFVACRKWRRANPHNDTNLGRWCIGTTNVQIGEFTYGDINVLTAGNNPSLKIGACCSIAKDVVFIIDNMHPLGRFSTFPFKVKVLGTERCEALSKGGIVLEDDVWIGYGSTILDGVHIGRGGVVAAGAVVAKDVEPYAVVGGVPAKLIKKRFNQDVIDRLLGFDYSTVDKAFVRAHLDQLYRSLDERLLREPLDEPGERHEL